MAKSNGELIDHLVDVRGQLHHHALPRDGAWHPDKQSRFAAEAIVIRYIVQKIAMDKIMPILFSPDRDEMVMDAARDAGVVKNIKVDVVGCENGKSVHFSVGVKVPSAFVSPEIILKIERELRKEPLRQLGAMELL